MNACSPQEHRCLQPDEEGYCHQHQRHIGSSQLSLAVQLQRIEMFPSLPNAITLQFFTLL